MEIGSLIRELRIKKGMTQEDLAEKTEVSARTIQRIENGDVDPRAYTLQMIAKALEVEFDLFVQNEQDESGEIQKSDDKKWLALVHLSGFLPLIFPALIIWQRQKDKTNSLAIHFRATIILQLCVLGITLVGLWIYWKVNQPTPLIGGLLAGGLLSLMNAIKVMNGSPFINPLVRNSESA